MILPFSLVLNGTPTLFPEKITQGLLENEPTAELMRNYQWPHNDNYRHIWSCRNDLKPKIHSMREDAKGRWKAGNNIHMVVNNRTKKIWQFAPVVPCISTQEISFFYCFTGAWSIFIDGELYVRIFQNKTYTNTDEMIVKVTKLAHNDGFEDYLDFLKYFTGNRGGWVWKGKIIHWTNLKY